MYVNKILFWSALLLGLFVSLPSVFGDEEEAPPENGNQFRVNDEVSFSLNGYLYLYHIRNHNCYYTHSNAAFTEASAGLGMDFDFRDEISGQVRLVGTGLFGRPENYLGVPPADMETLFDLANVTWHTRIGNMDFDLTAGLQELLYGDGLLVMDGYSETRAVWTTPIRSFPAIKGSLDLGGENWFDLFSAHVRNDFVSYEAYLADQTYNTGGSLSGANLHLNETQAGTFDFGLFYKDEDNQGTLQANPGSDTLAISVRDEFTYESFTLSAELIRQYGQTRVVRGMVGTQSMNRRAWGGQVTGTYQLSDEGIKPYLRARYARFSGDRNSTSRVEAFDPFFFGWGDWGTWWIGDMTSFELPHSNARNLMLEFGFSPTDVSSLRFLYFNTNLDERVPSISNVTTWSHEVNIVYDYFFSDYVFAGMMLGAAEPRKAAELLNGNDKTNVEAITWIGFSF
ncbi:MAG: alginate export family protein [Planctomycetes bacterium]|nr:alginate export family protein [Planctomycetota bacterium]